ncbi:hypothetical protein EB077_14235 [bacterium]|nr:hypothetical protein [bacterium]
MNNEYFFKYYVYAHLINNTIFYIGKGCDNRAIVKHGRTREWYNIVQQNSGHYDIEVFAYGLSEQAALCLEAALINKIGYKHLVNKKQKITKK